MAAAPAPVASHGEALAPGSEVLFSCADNRWVAVPLALEGELRAGLGLPTH